MAQKDLLSPDGRVQLTSVIRDKNAVKF